MQSEFYATQSAYATAHENARVATERVAGEIRSVMADGFVVAGARTLTIRSPISLTAVCDVQLSSVHVHNEGGEASTITSEVAGIALRNEATGAWTYRSTSWAFINGGGGAVPAQRCATNGADTVGATAEFHRLNFLIILFGIIPDQGDVLMLYRETTFRIQDSLLEPGRLALFRQPSGGSLVELVSGIDASAQFQYRRGASTYADTVVAADLDDIDAVRIVADARRPAVTGGAEDITFGWSVNVSLRNAP